MNISKLTKEELELMSNKDITNLLLMEKGRQTTADLYKRIISLLELDEDTKYKKIGDYYISLATDKRFILLEDGTWDLRSRYTSDKIIKIEDEDEEDIEEDINEEELEEIDSFDSNDSSDLEDINEDYKDLVILDEDELELEQ